MFDKNFLLFAAQYCLRKYELFSVFWSDYTLRYLKNKTTLITSFFYFHFAVILTFT